MKGPNAILLTVFVAVVIVLLLIIFGVFNS
jgi:hypothetical protein